jgi:serine/threonine-protein kinase
MTPSPTGSHPDNSFPGTPTATDLTPTQPDGAPAVPVERAGRYELLAEVARGGMGAVYRARDTRLQRDLAVKVLLPRYAERPDVARRFLEEAQVTAQLQHPAIDPVHEVGELPDGRPFFAMKLVKGQTLAELLARRPDPAHDRPRFLAIFQQVCQALAYAHSKGVMHRDLKPGNVMVGAFGEVQVMDWGLAKVLAGQPLRPAARQEESAAPVVSVVETVRSGERDFDTQAGAVLGTFAYMPPEQARGQAEALDRRCDVFALGAVLCEMLTGAPPYTAASPEERRSQAVLGQVGPALERLDSCGADPELVVLARACLAPDPADRPADAGAVAEAVRSYLDGVQDKLRRAEVERAEAQVKAREERKRRRLAVALAAAVLVCVLGAGGTALWYVRDRDAKAADLAARQAETERAVGLALGKAEQARDQARAVPRATSRDADAALVLWGQAEAAVGQAEAALATGVADEALRQRAASLRQEATQGREEAEQQRGQLAREDKLLGDLDAARMARSTATGSSSSYAASEAAYERALAGYGLDIRPEMKQDLAARIRAERPAVREALVAALDDWAYAATYGPTRWSVNALRELAPNGFSGHNC